MIVIPRGCNGPPDSGQGGWAAGLIAERIGSAASVSLHTPPPLQKPLTLAVEDDVVTLHDGDTLVGAGHPAAPSAVDSRAVSWDEALEGRARYLSEIAPRHMFPTCFGCGPRRNPDDALCVFPGAVPDGDLVAAPWKVIDVTGAGRVSIPLVWAAMDCPTGMSFQLLPDWDPARAILLANLTIDISRLPACGDRCVITAWPLKRDGRKLTSAGALWSADGDLMATSSALWIEPRQPG